MTLLRCTLLSIAFLAVSCTAPQSGYEQSTPLAPGYYIFDAKDWFMDVGMAEVSTRNGNGVSTVKLLQHRKGAFGLKPTSASGDYKIVESDISFDKIRRVIKGSGKQNGLLIEGKAVIWIKSVGPFSRNHRSGKWTLRPASAQEIATFKRKKNRSGPSLDF